MLINAEHGNFLDKKVSEIAKIIDNIYKVVEATNTNILDIVKDRFLLLNSKCEEELQKTCMAMERWIDDKCKASYEQAQHYASTAAQKQKAEFKIEFTKSDVRMKKMVINEIDKQVNLQLSQMVNVPGLIGEGCKYPNFHQCMTSINHELQSSIGGLKCEQVSMENRLDEALRRLEI